MTTPLRRAAAFAALALALASCSTGPAEPAAPPPLAMGGHDHPACVAARDAAVFEGLRWLSDVEVSAVSGRSATGPNTVVFQDLVRSCSNDPAAAYSEFLVRTHEGFVPATPVGEVTRREFLTSGCGVNSPYPLAALSEEARRVCTGG